MPRISLGTVYRNLEILCQLGQARKLESGGHQARYDGTLSPHAHVRCIHCGKAADVKAVLLPDAVAQAKAMEGYKILDYRLEFTGVCPKCRKQQE
jgi:Fur family ferric uptake transcriptional regulator